MNLAISLLRMAPGRFEMPYKKIYNAVEGTAATKESTDRGLKALYFLLIRKAKIENISTYLKEGT
jgi:hypothetical protein